MNEHPLGYFLKNLGLSIEKKNQYPVNRSELFNLQSCHDLNKSLSGLRVPTYGEAVATGQTEYSDSRRAVENAIDLSRNNGLWDRD